MPRRKGAAKTGGRKRGTPNKTTASVKEAIEQAYEAAGGDPAFGEWARTNQTDFYTRILTRILPKELEVTGNAAKPIGVTLRFGKMEIPL
jgi:hypothetical protein